MSRKRIPARRAAETFTFSHCYPGAGPREFTAAVGYYPDGRIGEVFVHLVNGAEKLVTVDAHDAAIVLSIAIQNGANLKQISESMLRDEDGTPHGFLGSLLDAIIAHG